MSFPTRQPVPINDAIFADVVESSRLAHDQKLLQLLQTAYSPDSPLYREVCLQVDRLGLLPFQVGEEAPVEPTEADAAPEKHLPRRELLSISTTVPQLTKNERRLSFELMHYIPNPSLVKPAETGISSVNVVNKVTDLEASRYLPTLAPKNALADKIKRYLGRFQLLNQNQRRKLNGKVPSKPSPPQIILAPRGDLGVAVGAERRLSVVGQNLPLYIKSQLEPKLTVESAPQTSAKAELAASSVDTYSHNSASAKKEDPRIHNLLANLESLYFHHDGNSTGETSFNTNNESTISDADREYILPNSFTQWNGRDPEVHVYQSSLEESEENTDDDDDEEYLFTVN